MEIKLVGWQSWTPCRPYPNIFDPLSRHFYSPFGQTGWNIRLSAVKKPPKPIAGWCSFYALGRNINEKNIISNTHILANIQTGIPTYIVVDDGWCSWGNWLTPDSQKFPQGMRSLSQNISSCGLKPAIWLSPFLTDTPTPYRLCVFPFKYILDFENPKVFNNSLEYIKIIIEKWGYQLLKLDFLFALHHLPRYKDSKTPDEILSSFLHQVKKTYPGIHLNACGCPLGPAVGNCDSMRISADIINPYLANIWPINKYFHTHRLKQLDQNLTCRGSTRKFWLLDPDAFVCRNSLGLSNSQIFKLQSLIKKANGVYFLGDDLTKLTRQQIDQFIKPLFQ